MTEGGYRTLWKNIIPGVGYKRIWKIITSFITIEELPEEDYLQIRQRKMRERIRERCDAEREKYSQIPKQCQEKQKLFKGCVVCDAKKEEYNKFSEAIS